jgi:hypothetical protein
MNERLALRVLSEIMRWDDARATDEFRWLSLMSRLKYDGYQDFLAGVRFLESLASWIQQFQPEERELAYAFVRKALVYIGPAEMQRLVELFYPDFVQRRLVQVVAEEHKIPAYRVWANIHTAAAYDKLLRRTLFIGLSEGARLDLFRRSNAGIVSNEQVLLATYVDSDKWKKLLKDLREDIKDPNAKFRVVYLIDDFVASGTTFIRKDAETGKWKGKLASFRENVGALLESHFDKDLLVCVHHYIANHRATGVLQDRYNLALNELGKDISFSRVEFTFGTVLPQNLPITESPLKEARDFATLARKYFDAEDPVLKNKHTEEGGTDVSLGFAGCALPLILEHNTPNNSVALLWAETLGYKDPESKRNRHAMRPLFRRRQRHS